MPELLSSQGFLDLVAEWLFVDRPTLDLDARLSEDLALDSIGYLELFFLLDDLGATVQETFFDGKVDLRSVYEGYVLACVERGLVNE